MTSINKWLRALLLPQYSKYLLTQKSFTGIPSTFDSVRETSCFNFWNGVLPNGFSNEKNWAKCAADQKDAGYWGKLLTIKKSLILDIEIFNK